MHELHQTIAAGELKINTSRAFALAEKGPVVILSRATPRAVLVAPDEWNRIAKRLEMLESLLEAQRIEARNDADDSWVTSNGRATEGILAASGVRVEDASRTPVSGSYAAEGSARTACLVRQPPGGGHRIDRR